MTNRLRINFGKLTSPYSGNCDIIKILPSKDELKKQLSDNYIECLKIMSEHEALRALHLLNDKMGCVMSNVEIKELIRVNTSVIK
jgi:hypothetical protein